MSRAAYALPLPVAVLLAHAAVCATAHAEPGDAASDAALLGEPPALAELDHHETDDRARFAARAQVQVSGLVGENVGLVLAPALAFGDHAVELALFVAGGSHLRTGLELHYRLDATERLSWWIGPGIAFDVLFAAEDTTIWTRLTTFSTGLDLALTEYLYVGLEFSFLPRVAPLAVTFVEQGDTTWQVEPDSSEVVFDLADWVLRPGVSLGLRL